MAVNQAAVELTRDDIAAMRLADGVSFSVNKGAAYIRTSLDDKYSDESRIYTAREQRLFPEVREIIGGRERRFFCDYRVEYYGPKYAPDAPYACCAVEMFARQSGAWRTIARLARPGDRVRLDWTGGNDSDNMRDVGYHRDELRLILVGPNGRDRLAFLAAVSVGPNNTARMVRVV